MVISILPFGETHFSLFGVRTKQFFIVNQLVSELTLSSYSFQRPSKAPQNPPPTARLLVNVYDKVSGNLLVTFGQNVSPEGQNKWEELSIGLTAKQAVDIEVICENTSATPVFFDNLEVKVQAVPTVLVVQENHYYPFGLGMKGLDWTLPTNAKEDKFTYNGKEKQTDFDLGWSDYGARQYDPQTSKFTSVDPHAENYQTLSSYSYVANNPLIFTDPTGKDIWATFYDEEGKRTNNIPEKVIRMFEEQYGIYIAYNSKTQMLSFDGYVGDAKTDDASKMLVSALQDKDHDKTKYGKIVMGEDIGNLSLHYLMDGGGMAESRFTDDGKKYDVAYINLRYFEEDGGYKGAKYVNLPKDANNLARAFEHEYFGHNVYGEGNPRASQDGNTYRTGSAEDVVNKFRIQRGLPIAYSYTTFTKLGSTFRIFGTAYNADKSSITAEQMKSAIKEAEKGNLTNKSYMIK